MDGITMTQPPQTYKPGQGLMEIRKVVSLVSFIQEQDSDVEYPSRNRHPASAAAEFGNQEVGGDDGQDFENAVAIHKIQIDGREGQEEVGPDERLLWALEIVCGFGRDKESVEEMAQGEVDQDDDQEFWEVVPESSVLAITVVLFGRGKGLTKVEGSV